MQGGEAELDGHVSANDAPSFFDPLCLLSLYYPPICRPSAGRRTIVVMASSVADLQKKFGISGSVEVAAGKSGSTVVGGRASAQMTIHMPPHACGRLTI